MNGAQFHFMFNHFPFVLLFVSLPILIAAYVRSNRMARVLAVVLIAGAALTGLLSLATGESAEDVVKPILTDAHQWIEIHEEAGEAATYMTIFTSLIAILSLTGFRSVQKFSRSIQIVVIIFTFLATVAMGRVGHLGGLIRHTELRGSNGSDGPASSK